MNFLTALPLIYFGSITLMPFGVIPLSGVIALLVGLVAAARNREGGVAWSLLPLAASELFFLFASSNVGLFPDPAYVMLGFGLVQLLLATLIVLACRRSPIAGLAMAWFSLSHSLYAAFVGGFMLARATF